MFNNTCLLFSGIGLLTGAAGTSQRGALLCRHVLLLGPLHHLLPLWVLVKVHQCIRGGEFSHRCDGWHRAISLIWVALHTFLKVSFYCLLYLSSIKFKVLPGSSYLDLLLDHPVFSDTLRVVKLWNEAEKSLQLYILGTHVQRVSGENVNTYLDRISI